MEITNIRFRKNTNKMWTYLSDGTLSKGQIDYILIRRKWKNSLKNTEAYNTFQSLGSDHRVVVCKVRVSFRKTHRPQKRVHLKQIKRFKVSMLLKLGTDSPA